MLGLVDQGEVTVGPPISGTFSVIDGATRVGTNSAAASIASWPITR